MNTDNGIQLTIDPNTGKYVITPLPDTKKVVDINEFKQGKKDKQS